MMQPPIMMPESGVMVQPDDVRIELVAAWKTANPSVVLRAFLELIDTNAAQIRSKAELP
jgi:hypothetical protein